MRCFGINVLKKTLVFVAKIELQNHKYLNSISPKLQILRVQNMRVKKITDFISKAVCY